MIRTPRLGNNGNDKKIKNRCWKTLAIALRWKVQGGGVGSGPTGVPSRTLQGLGKRRRRAATEKAWYSLQESSDLSNLGWRYGPRQGTGFMPVRTIAIKAGTDQFIYLECFPRLAFCFALQLVSSYCNCFFPITPPTWKMTQEASEA